MIQFELPKQRSETRFRDTRRPQNSFNPLMEFVFGEPGKLSALFKAIR
jgi:hypothetical protein